MATNNDMSAEDQAEALAAFGVEEGTAATTTTTPVEKADDSNDDTGETETLTKPAVVTDKGDEGDDEDTEEVSEEKKAASKEQEERDANDPVKAVEKALTKPKDKPTTKPDAATAEATKTKEEAEKKDKEANKDGTDELSELEKQVNQPHVRPKTKELFAKVKQTADKYKEEATKLKQEVEALKAAGINPEVKAELDEYRDIVKAHYVERSVEVKKNFDTPIAEARSNLEKLLTETYGTDEGSKTVISKLVNAEGLASPIVTKNIKALEAAGQIEEAEAIKDTLKYITNLNKQRTEYINKEKTNYTERVKQTEEQEKARIATVRTEAAKVVQEELKAIESQNTWLQKVTIDPNEAEDVRKLKEAKNKQIAQYTEESKAFFGKLAEGQYTAKDLVQMAFRMVEANHYKTELKQALARVDKLTGRLEEYKKTGKASAANVTIGKNKTSTKEFSTEKDAIDSMFS